MRWLWYYAKAQVRGGWLVFLAVFAFLFLLLFDDAFRGRYPAPRAPQDVMVLIEVYLPLVTALLLAGAPTLEHEAGTHELYLSYPQPAWFRLLQKLAIPGLLWAVGLIVTAGIAHLWYTPLTLSDVLKTTAAPSLALGAAALAGSAIARHQLGGVLATTLWWATDLKMPTQLNEWAYLFNRYQPMPTLNADTMRQHLLIVAVVGLVLSLWLAERRQRWVTA